MNQYRVKYLEREREESIQCKISGKIRNHSHLDKRFTIKILFRYKIYNKSCHLVTRFTTKIVI